MNTAMEKGATYNWKCEPDKLLKYLGTGSGGSNGWHQFALINDEQNAVWCEVLPWDLHMLERTPPLESAP